MSEERIVAVGPDNETARLSVLTPFHRHDPSALLARFGAAPAGVEFILLDDGSGSADLACRVISAAERLNAPARIIIWSENRGRAAARNRLITEARGDYVLLLDADLIPDAPRFLSIWLGILETQRPMAAFGGLSLAHAPHTPETALHRDLFWRSNCRLAWLRQRTPAQATASANLAVRRDFAAPFDPGFVGWGFEDIDWALRAAQRAPILHVDNPASHTDLDDVAALMRKSEEAGPNFARLASKHPRAVRRFAAHRAARVLKRAPARAHLRKLCAWIARDPRGVAPMALRRAAFKLHRAAHFAEHLP
jgi:glycosyltransferase involved in cell wall biosynthesis